MGAEFLECHIHRPVISVILKSPRPREALICKTGIVFGTNCIKYGGPTFFSSTSDPGLGYPEANGH